ncbi:MAG: reductive dehalogenase domain-containing protein [Halopseudomonas sp.]
MEQLKRDTSQIEAESKRAAQGKARPPLKDSRPLLTATRVYQDLFSELREVEHFSKRAPVPDDLSLRARDLKGGGYFLDASHMGLCELPKNAWLPGWEEPHTHTHALVILVEFPDPIDEDNLAAGWVSGIEQELATTRAAEIAIILSGHISALGFDARAHWLGASEVDMDQLAVLSGLAVRQGDCLFNPFVGNRFVLAVVTSDYPAATDLPLAPHTGKAGGLGYFLGASGAVSGLERWRRRRRPSHLGPYAVETLKRVPEPTTKIFPEEVSRVPSRAMFYIRAGAGDLGAKPQRERPRWAYKHPLSQGLLRMMWPMVPYQDSATAPQPTPGTQNGTDNAKALKALSHYLGSAVTGICEIPDYCWYSHRKDGSRIDPYHKYAIVMLIDQGTETFQGACGDDWISGSQSMRSYMRGAEIAGTLAGHIRELGYPARAHTSLDSDVLHVPLVLLSGLGEQSRIGESTVNPFLGPRFKTVVLTTDIPLEVDQPIDFGLQKFCGRCVKCARECPSQSIPFGDKIMYNGYETWKPDSERCTMYRMGNIKGSACGRCIKTCPLTKDVTWDGPIHSRIGSWLGINALWLKSLLPPLAIWLDDALGHGNPNDAKKWWLDLEVTGEQCHEFDSSNYCSTPKAVNRKKINPDRKPQKKQKIAIFPPSVLPPPGEKNAFPTNRRLGLELAAQAETVEQAVERRKRGESAPAMFNTPSWD